MTTTEYRGYSIRQQKEFGPLRLLKWLGIFALAG
jgi:hypothetical protein